MTNDQKRIAIFAVASAAISAQTIRSIRKQNRVNRARKEAFEAFDAACDQLIAIGKFEDDRRAGVFDGMSREEMLMHLEFAMLTAPLEKK